MKNLSLLCVLIVLTGLWGCNNKDEKLEELQKQNQELAIQLTKSDSLANVYRSTIKDIEAVIESVLPGKNAFDITPAEKKLRTRLIQKLTEIDSLLLEKEKKYNALNRALVKSNARVSEMTEKIEELNSEISEKENLNANLSQTVKKLEKQVTEKSSQIESVIREKQKLNEVLETKTNTINTAHFIFDSEDELREKAIIEKTGGFLGLLGRVNALNPKLDKNQLQEIDIRNKTSFTLNAEKKQIELITYHPPSSYELNESGTGTSLLTITNPAEFWRNSKYLVITY